MKLSFSFQFVNLTSVRLSIHFVLPMYLLLIEQSIAYNLSICLSVHYIYSSLVRTLIYRFAVFTWSYTCITKSMLHGFKTLLLSFAHYITYTFTTRTLQNDSIISPSLSLSIPHSLSSLPPSLNHLHLSIPFSIFLAHLHLLYLLLHLILFHISCSSYPSHLHMYFSVSLFSSPLCPPNPSLYHHLFVHFSVRLDTPVALRLSAHHWFS